MTDRRDRDVTPMASSVKIFTLLGPTNGILEQGENRFSGGRGRKSQARLINDDGLLWSPEESSADFGSVRRERAKAVSQILR